MSSGYATPTRSIDYSGEEEAAGIYPARSVTDDLFVGAMHQEIKLHLFSQMGRDLRFFTVEQPGYESWARGAGSLVLRHFFVSPVRMHAERVLI
jgi:hypothetical protein